MMIMRAADGGVAFGLGLPTCLWSLPLHHEQ
jgi:hypothetical protein